MHLLTNRLSILFESCGTVDNYMIFLPLLAFPEGLLNGMAGCF